MLRDPLPRDVGGRPLASTEETRLALAITSVASLFFALTAAWELFGPILAGHYASSASMGIIAENMLRHHIPGPVWEYTEGPPTAAQYYCHHPWGIFWTTTGMLAVFGRHDFVCRLPAVLLSAATPPLLYGLGRAIWRPLAGAVAATAFVVLPITLAFANMNALEVPVTAWSLMGLYGFVRMTQSPKKRYLGLALFGFFMAMNADWPAFVLVAELLAFGFYRGVIAKKSVWGPFPRRSYATFWVGLAALAVATGLLYLALFQAAGKLNDLFHSYDARSAGREQPLDQVLADRRYWIELMFTPLAISLGKAAAVVALARLLVLRREHEILPLALLGMALFQYLVFKQGADIHIFWPHYFGAYFALGMGALSATSIPAIEALLRQLGLKRALAWSVVPWLLPLVAVLRDGLPALVYARQTGGRFNEKGNLISSDGDKTAFLQWLEPRLPRDRIIDMHEGMHATWAQSWTLGGRVVSFNRAIPKGPAKDRRDTYLADLRYLDSASADALFRNFQVTVVGSFLQVQRQEPWAPLAGFALEEREPNLFERYFLNGTEPVRTVVADPFVTWEMRYHFDQPAEPPNVAPTTSAQRRIAHNIAVAAGDTARADALLASLEDALSPPRFELTNGSSLLGVTYTKGAEDQLTVYVLAREPMARGTGFSVKSRVLQAPWGSLTMADPTSREVALPFLIPPERFRAGFVYENKMPIRKRPGKEEFVASFSAPRGRGPGPTTGGKMVVLTLP